MNKKCPLNSTTLRILAMALMLLDHLWATVIPGNDWMTYLGRLAFPIFAFQAAEGYAHTHDFNHYCRRLLIFGLISEIPFNLMIIGSPVFPFHQNVMFTLLLGLLACRQIDLLRTDSGNPVRRIALLALIGLGSILLFPDYGMLGVMTVIVFHVFRNVPGAKLAQLAFLCAIHVFGYEGQMLPLFGGTFEFPVQGFAVLALIPIWLYNGEKGPGGRAFQYAAYAFYPAHMLLLWCIRSLI